MPALEALSTDSPVRQRWLSEDEAIDAILAYEASFGAPHLLLAGHAAFPLVLTSELLNLLHINFLDDEHIHWLAEPDFLLSPLCRPLGDGYYQVVPSVRELLLADLLDRTPAADALVRRLADFLLAYLEHPLGLRQPPQMRRVQQWIAWSYLAPQAVVDDMSALLTASLSGVDPTTTTLTRHLQVATMMEIVRDPLMQALPESAYRNLLDAAQVLARYWYVKPDAAEDPARTPVAGSSNPLLQAASAALTPSVSQPEGTTSIEVTGGARADRSVYLAQKRSQIQSLVERGASIIFVHGPPHSGKSSLLFQLGQFLGPRFNGVVRHFQLSPTFSTADAMSHSVRARHPQLELPAEKHRLREHFLDTLLEEPALLLVSDVSTAEQIDDLAPPRGSVLVASSSRLIEVPRAAVVELGWLLQPPAPPEPFIDRPEFNTVLGGLREATSSPRGRVSLRRPPLSFVIRLSGREGMGATSLAAKLAADPEVRRVFHDDIFWLSFQHSNQLPSLLAELATALGEDVSGITEVQERLAVVDRRLVERRTLLIIDTKFISPDVEMLWHLPTTATLLVTPPLGDESRFTNVFDLVVELAPLTLEASVRLTLYWCQYWQKSFDSTTVQRLAVITGGLPGAIVLAVPRPTGQLEAEILLAQWESEREKAAELDHYTYWRWAVLYERQREAFTRLHVFGRDEFTLEAAARIWGTESQPAHEGWLAAFREQGLLEIGSSPDLYVLSNAQFRLAAAFAADARDVQPEMQLESPPQPIISTIPVTMTPQQRQHHDENREIVGALIQDWHRARSLPEADQRRLMIALHRMRMSCDNSYLVDHESVHGPKTDAIMALLEELCRDANLKVVVFSQWVRMLELLARRCAEHDLDCVVFHGGLPGRERKSLVDRFRDTSECRVLLSTDTDGTGLDLRSAGAVINVDPPWNPAVLQQRLDRVNRPGRQHPVRVVKLVTEASIEEGMVAVLHVQKSPFAEMPYSEDKVATLSSSKLGRFIQTVEAVFAAIPTVPAQVDPEIRSSRGICHREIRDAQNKTRLPGKLVRSEGDPPSADTPVNEVYDALGHTFSFFWNVFNVHLIDDQGTPLVAVVHYGNKFTNALWDGNQLVVGDGDGEIFNRFTGLDVVAHELGRGFVAATTKLVWEGQAGAVGESIADVLASLVKQYAHGQTAAEADWLIGTEVFSPRVQAKGLRSLAAPGTAYKDSARLGSDPQPRHMSHYVKTTKEGGGHHINSGIPNHAFYRFATAIGGRAWEQAGQVWYETLRDSRLKPKASLAHFSGLTRDACQRLFGTGSAEAKALVKAWRAVGIEA